jgi:prepilin-type processing-associated H-X9-DG protein
MHTQDHNGRLPTSASYGTLFGGQGPWYNRDDRRLQNHIREYTGAEESSTWSTQGAQMTFDPSFSWPELISKGKAGASSVMLNMSVKFLSGGTETTISPWPGTKPDGGSFVGRRFDEISNPGQAMTFFEVDQKNTTAGWKNQQPTGAIHGNYRNCLYFDGHVDRLPASP